MVTPTQAELHKTIRAHGLSPSAQRVAIYQFLVTHPIHPTVDDIYKALRPKIKTLSRTTVYNVLHAFVENGLTTKVHIEDLELRYDANVTPHAHFKCLNCGNVYDFGETPTLDLLPLAAIPEDFKTTSATLILRGKCPHCK